MILEALAFTIARWALLAVALWWVAGFLLWAVALSDRQGGTTLTVMRLADRFALPGCRRLATGIAACALITLPACSPPESEPSLVYLGEVDSSTATTAKPAVTTTTPPTTRTPATQPPTTQPPTTQPPAPTTQPPTTQPPTTEAQAPSAPILPEPAQPTTPPATSHQVVAGDHLWGIAAQHLSLRSPDSSPSNAAVARYWRQVITANATTLRSGDPNLIHPGEWVSLPPVG